MCDFKVNFESGRLTLLGMFSVNSIFCKEEYEVQRSPKCREIMRKV